MKSTMKILKVCNRLAQHGVAVAIGAITLLSGCTWDHIEPDTCFESQVLPIFITYCSTTGCHNANDRANGYDLTNYNGIMRGVTPKNVAGSEVITAMGALSEEKMPPSGFPQPSSDQIATLKSWVRAGAANSVNCSTVGCDTAATVSYSADIQPMMQTYCNGCHGGGSPSAGLNLSDFATVKQTAQSGRLPGSIAGDPRYKAMPPSGNLLSSCYVDKINKWVAAGAPNN
jgi:Planctomycete cytochrome C